MAECHHPTEGNVRELAQLLRVNSIAFPPQRLAPELGADIDRILGRLGMSADEVASMREGGAIR